jgi:hypothetical protein
MFSLLGYAHECSCVKKIKLKRARVLRFAQGAWIKGCRWVRVPENPSIVYLKTRFIFPKMYLKTRMMYLEPR